MRLTAKSNVVNNNRNTAANPPQKEELDYIAQSAYFFYQSDRDKVWMMESFIRSFAALGDCAFSWHAAPSKTHADVGVLQTLTRQAASSRTRRCRSS